MAVLSAQKSLTSSDSNISTTWSTPTAPLANSDYSSLTSGYTTAAMMCDSTYGAWYNYVPAMTIGTSGSTSAALSRKLLVSRLPPELFASAPR